MEEKDVLNTCDPIALPKKSLWYMVANLVIVMVVGVLGNLLTLAALPYVRYRYGEEFTILKTNSASLLLHLSFCDLLYCIIGMPHFIQVYTIGYFPYSVRFCWWLGMLRNLVAFADFTTIAVISVCVCRFYFCKTCQIQGPRTNHSDHDNIFGRRRMFIIFLFIWLSSFLYISLDVFDIAASYEWSGGLFGCNSVFDVEKGHIKTNGFHHYLAVIVNMMIIVVCYSLVARKLWNNKRMTQDFNPDLDDKMKMLTRKHQTTLFILCLTYVVFILPALCINWAGSVQVIPVNIHAKAAVTLLYFWLYGINFIIYVMTNTRLRAAYIRFFRDFIQFSGSLPPTLTSTLSSPPAWWANIKNSTNKITQHSQDVSVVKSKS